MPKIERLLVANRGEIAIRIFRAATELKLRTVAIYSYEDRYSLHRYKADESYQIGPNEEPLRPYLDIEEILRIAKRKKIDAIHPGYGFLSENIDFARRCKEEGITFIGPEASIMEQLGNKIAAKNLAKKVGVPMIEGADGLKEEAEIIAAAEKIGFPIMLKAASGGGGRGMRVVRDLKSLLSAYREASGEAAKAFGDPTIFLEKFVEDPKHIEVQLLGDLHGNLVHLHERDCSVQRRFQKVVEVAPASTLNMATREQLHEYALRIAKAVNYTHAGTVEFLVDKNENIYFIEVNPRIQVEHTITEEITGYDIVKAQIQVAQGEPLDGPMIGIPNQEAIKVNGHAIQCRITTEDPANGFSPDYGTIIAYRNAAGMGIRLDEGSSYPGVKISPFFDSMLVKVSAWGTSLDVASDRMRRALSEFRIRGVQTNIPFLQNVIAHPVFRSGQQRVGFIENHPDLLEIQKTRNRGTRVLSYMSEVIVNGNPEIKNHDPNRKFQEAIVPEYDRHSAHTPGTKNLLTELGPAGLSEWLKDQKKIYFTDTTFRDAHQSLLATRVRTIDLLNIAESYSKSAPQLFSAEIWGGATFDVCMRFLKEDPWERLRLLRQAMPNVLTQMLIRASNAVGYKAYPDNLVEKFIAKSWENGVDVFRIFDSLNWTEQLKVSTQAVLRETEGLAEVSICYTGDISDPKNHPKYSLEYYLDLAKRIEDMGAHILAIKDMAGLLKPYAAEKLIKELKKSISIPIHLHTHDTAGIQSATYLKAIEAGVDVVDVAIDSMSGLTSQPNFNSMLAALQGHERENPMDLQKMNEMSVYWERIRDWYYPFESGLKSGTAQLYDHEIPGGQYSNLRPQARGLGIEDQFETIKKNYKIANQLMGDLVKVTPSSKVVGDLAMFMTTNGYSKEDLMAKGGDISFPDSLISFFKGELGQPHGGFPILFQKLVLKNEKPFKERPNAHLDPVDFDNEMQAFQKEYGKDLSELDFLSYRLYPKVFLDYLKFKREFGDVWRIPSLAFWFGLKQNEEVMVEIDQGKTILVRFLGITEPNEMGYRQVYFKLNGQNRHVEVLDRMIEVSTVQNKKAIEEHEIGSPLQGKLVQVLVKVGDRVEKNDPLFVIEAMKMESTVLATRPGTVRNIDLSDNSMVAQDDLVLSLES